MLSSLSSRWSRSSLSLSPVPSRASVLVTAAALVAGMLGVAAPAEAANRVTPGDFTGYGFDQCVTQDQETMDAWLTSSPYWAVGVYMAGDSRYCGADKQVELTPEWVATQLSAGWKVLPITVGPQASCVGGRFADDVRINPDPTDSYAAARVQGRQEALTTVGEARLLGITATSTLWYDIEAFDINKLHCRESALTFLSAWTRTLHRQDYVSGVYSSAASGIRMLDDARVAVPRRHVMPDRVWIAEWVSADSYRPPPTKNPPTLSSVFLRPDGWIPGGRMRQYRGSHLETYGGVTINIDTNYLDLGRGTRPGLAPVFCGGVQVDFPRYHRQAFGQRNAQVKAAQCLLRARKLYTGTISGYYNRATVRAVKAFQTRRDLPVSGVLTRSTWTVLLSIGTRPVLKVGSGGPAVRRLQRAMNAAEQSALPVDGLFGPSTTAAVRAYQYGRGLRRTGVVTPELWALLQRGLL